MPLCFTNSVHVNEPNLKLQCFGEVTDFLFGCTNLMKVNLKFLNNAQILTYKYFLRIEKYFGKATINCEMDYVHTYQNIIQALLENSSKRFKQFKSLEKTIKVIKYPNVVG